MCGVSSQHDIKFTKLMLVPQPWCPPFHSLKPGICASPLSLSITVLLLITVVPHLMLHPCPRNELYWICLYLLYPLHSMDTQKSWRSSQTVIQQLPWSSFQLTCPWPTHYWPPQDRLKPPSRRRVIGETHGPIPCRWQVFLSTDWPLRATRVPMLIWGRNKRKEMTRGTRVAPCLRFAPCSPVPCATRLPPPRDGVACRHLLSPPCALRERSKEQEGSKERLIINFLTCGLLNSHAMSDLMVKQRDIYGPMLNFLKGLWTEV